MPKDKRPQWDSSRFDNDTQVVLYIALRQFMLIDREAPDVEDQRQILLVTNPQLTAMDLSNLTEKELDMFQRLINTGIEMARPLCVERDERTAEALRSNDVRNKRLWRAEPRYIDFTKGSKPDATQPAASQQVPVVPENEGDEREHDQSVPSRPGGPDDLPWYERDTNGS